MYFVAPYAADSTNKKMLELGQQRLRDAVAAAPKLTDQSLPVGAMPALQLCHERTRAFCVDEERRRIMSENKKLLGSLNAIVQRPGMLAQRSGNDSGACSGSPGLSSRAGVNAPATSGGNAPLRRRRRYEIELENEASLGA
eukprot:TRINITY_DN9448_c0_g1_i2.p1 TRINITY_DN9448_c0_g1~~TRINITY_DN9448_c0_g1_i2.p1  ORF type:complete len:141 (-),score=30.68 TRINITY_DN9448_c0_g1_i2:88-510(-)